MNLDIGATKDTTYNDLKWVIMDIRDNPKTDIRFDLNTGGKWPIEDCSCDNIYCSMTLEHIRIDLLMSSILEMRRVLKPLGIIRVVVPDIEIGIKLLQKSPGELARFGMPFVPDYYADTPMAKFIAWIVSPGSGGGSGHQNGFDWQTLHWYFFKAGFQPITKMGWNVCSPQFKGKDNPRYKDYALYVEATK